MSANPARPSTDHPGALDATCAGGSDLHQRLLLEALDDLVEAERIRVVDGAIVAALSVVEAA